MPSAFDLAKDHLIQAAAQLAGADATAPEYLDPVRMSLQHVAMLEELPQEFAKQAMQLVKASKVSLEEESDRQEQFETISAGIAGLLSALSAAERDPKRQRRRRG